MRSRAIMIAVAVAAFLAPSASAQDNLCVNVYHDEASEEEPGLGPINAIMLANVLGHWPQYEVRVRPIADYNSIDHEACKATIYLGTSDDTEMPSAFLSDFFQTDKRVAWIGFGVQNLDSKRFAKTFRHRVSGQVTIDDPKAKIATFFQFVSYKNSLFRKSVEQANGTNEGAFEAMRFVSVDEKSDENVLAYLIHNKTYESIPYFLRSGSKFLVGDIPFSYMHEADRYFAFADFLFEILDEQPRRVTPLAFARTEDIHGFYERPLLEAAFDAQRSENVPISIAHIPLFMDPLDAFGLGTIKTPKSAADVPEFLSLVEAVAKDDRNAIIMHGVTHQFGETKNPHTGTSGDDYEFWDMVANRPVKNDSVAATLDRLALALSVFDAYKLMPRFWVTPHYHASAVNSRVFAKVFPWQVGRATYFPSSFKPSFTIPAAAAGASLSMPPVAKQGLDDLKSNTWADLDEKSVEGQTQMFPFEIYRDVYGQRILPETLGYLSYATSEQTSFIRTAEDMLADARRNSVVRDYWASFFYHPYIFAAKADGGVGRYLGDTLELRKLLVGLKLLGYSFIGLSEFEASLRNNSGTAASNESSAHR